MDTILTKYFPIIKTQYPEISPNLIKYFDDGHDHYIFLLRNGIAFRMPRSNEHGLKDAVENIFLPEFAKQSPVPIQVFTPHIDTQFNIAYQTYHFIYGSGLTKEVADYYTMEDKLAIAKQIGRFLKVLHAFPIEIARAMHMDELDPKGYYDFFEHIWAENKNVIYPLLSQEQQQWCDCLFDNYLQTKTELFTLKVIHNDMLPEHIIVDKQKQVLSGIIDFALRIADPARDFMFLHVYGNEFLDTALSEYGSVDKTFKQRRKFYGGNFYIMYFYNALTKDLGKTEIEIHKNALTRYIAENPAV